MYSPRHAPCVTCRAAVCRSVHLRRVVSREYVSNTVYGAARTSPREYYAHHAAAISSAIVSTDARTLLSYAEYLGRLRIRGTPST